MIEHGLPELTDFGIDKIMPECILRVYGKNFDVDTFLEGTTLKPYAVWHKGEENSIRKEVYQYSGFQCDVSTASDDMLEPQIEAALSFLTLHYDSLAKLTGYEYEAYLDFGIFSRLGEDAEGKYICVQNDYFPPALLKAAGSLGIGIELSIYWSDD
jgi:hypothetical protein